MTFISNLGLLALTTARVLGAFAQPRAAPSNEIASVEPAKEHTGTFFSAGNNDILRA